MTWMARRLLAAALALGLAACNRSAGGQPPAEAALTSVGATLTAAPTLPSAQTRTPPPRATTIPSPSSTASPIPTEGPNPSTPTPSLAPDDPRSGIDLGSPDYRDDFNNDLTWVGPDFAGASNRIQGGRLLAIDHYPDDFIWWSTTVPDVDSGDLYAEITAEVGDCSSRDSYGMAVRVTAPSFNSGYAAEFSCDGAYRIRRFLAGSVQTLLDWTSGAAIHAGPDAVNRMGILVRAGNLHVVANGTVLGHLSGAIFDVGTFGLFASSEETVDLTVYFDDFALWRLGS
jgi:hypothetical protein